MLIILLLVAILFIVVSTTRFKLHPFLALLIAAIGFGLLSGMPLGDIIASVNNGFGSTVGSIGIVIVIGCIIGTFLEESGGAYVMARSMMRLAGEKRVPLVMLILGYFISIPVYADSGFVILAPLNRALSKKAKITLASTAIALSLGLTLTLFGAAHTRPHSRRRHYGGRSWAGYSYRHCSQYGRHDSGTHLCHKIRHTFQDRA